MSEGSRVELIVLGDLGLAVRREFRLVSMIGLILTS